MEIKRGGCCAVARSTAAREAPGYTEGDFAGDVRVAIVTNMAVIAAARSKSLNFMSPLGATDVPPRRGARDAGLGRRGVSAPRTIVSRWAAFYL